MLRWVFLLAQESIDKTSVQAKPELTEREAFSGSRAFIKWFWPKTVSPPKGNIQDTGKGAGNPKTGSFHIPTHGAM